MTNQDFITLFDCEGKVRIHFQQNTESKKKTTTHVYVCPTSFFTKEKSILPDHKKEE